MEELQMIVGARNIGIAMGLSPRRVYEMSDKGELPTVKLGGSIAIRRVKLLAFLERLEATSRARV